MIKKQLVMIMILLYCVVSFGQENEKLYILEADSTWQTEVIKFPLSFAKDIKYEGYEDLRFAKNWSKPESSEFFTYAFVWNINLSEQPTLEMIEANIKLYYDGLMSAVNKDKEFNVPKTKVNFKQINNSSELPKFKGVMDVYDSFFTKKVITLYVTSETSYCKVQNKYVMLFRVSSLNYENKVWNKLKTVTLVENYCEK